MSKNKELNFSKIEAIGKDNYVFLSEITDSYLDLIQDFKEQYRSAALSGDPLEFQIVTHKVKGSLRFLEAYRLLQIIAEFKAELQQGKQTEKSTRTSIEAVESICDSILDLLRSKKEQLTK